MRIALALIAAASLAPPLFAAETRVEAAHDHPIPFSRAARAAAALRIDGKLDEQDWGNAAVTDSFTQIDPAEGRPATVRTEVRVLYDDDFLYVGARMHDIGPPRARLGSQVCLSQGQ